VHTEKKVTASTPAPAPAPAPASADEAEEVNDSDFDAEAEAREAEEAQAAAEEAAAAEEEEAKAEVGKEPPVKQFAGMTITTASTTLSVPALIYMYYDTEGRPLSRLMCLCFLVLV